jgi:hypothetical protein
MQASTGKITIHLRLPAPMHKRVIDYCRRAPAPSKHQAVSELLDRALRADEEAGREDHGPRRRKGVA